MFHTYTLVLFMTIVQNSYANSIEETVSTLEIYNNCPFDVCPGVQSDPLLADGGFCLKGFESRTFTIPKNWSNVRIWPRRNCTGDEGSVTCESGSCGPHIKCNGRGPITPATQAEFALGIKNGSETFDVFDISLANGYNLPMIVYAREYSVETTGLTSEQCNIQPQSYGCIQGKDLLMTWKHDEDFKKIAHFEQQSDQNCTGTIRGNPCMTWVEPPCKDRSEKECEAYAKFFKAACPFFSVKHDVYDESGVRKCKPAKGRLTGDYVLQIC